MTAARRRVVLAVPGPIDTPSGGYAYDRRMLAELAALGWDARPLALAPGFPGPAPGDIDDALCRLARTEPGTVLLMDGLALGGLPPTGLAGLGRPLVALIHHPLAAETGLDAAAAGRLQAGEKAALAACRAVITVSPHVRAVLETCYGVPAPAITLAPPGTAPAPRAPADGVPPRLIAVGSLVPRKGYDVLLDALDLLDGLDFSLTIVGASQLDPAAAARIAARVAARRGTGGPQVRLAGQLAPPELAALRARSDALVHPALYEGYGMVLAEALRCGLPIVCTTGGASAETVPDAAALKVPPGDAPALAAALRRLVSEPGLRRRLADAAFAAGRNLPSWEESARIVACVLARAAGDPPSGAHPSGAQPSGAQP